MPICEVHLEEGAHGSGTLDELLVALSQRYASVLESPVERVRVLLTLHEHAAAPWFTALVLEGRPAEQRLRLLAGLTDVLVEVLGVERARVGGRIVPVHPDDWGIGGTPASAVRASEIASRSRSAQRSAPLDV